jgi:hypothetical protein
MPPLSINWSSGSACLNYSKFDHHVETSSNTSSVAELSVIKQEINRVDIEAVSVACRVFKDLDDPDFLYKVRMKQLSFYRHPS